MLNNGMPLKSSLVAFKTVESGTIRHIGYKFLLAFCNNYVVSFPRFEFKIADLRII